MPTNIIELIIGSIGIIALISLLAKICSPFNMINTLLHIFIIIIMSPVIFIMYLYMNYITKTWTTFKKKYVTKYIKNLFYKLDKQKDIFENVVLNYVLFVRTLIFFKLKEEDEIYQIKIKCELQDYNKHLMTLYLINEQCAISYKVSKFYLQVFTRLFVTKILISISKLYNNTEIHEIFRKYLDNNKNINDNDDEQLEVNSQQYYKQLLEKLFDQEYDFSNNCFGLVFADYVFLYSTPGINPIYTIKISNPFTGTAYKKFIKRIDEELNLVGKTREKANIQYFNLDVMKYEKFKSKYLKDYHEQSFYVSKNNVSIKAFVMDKNNNVSVINEEQLLIHI